MKWGVVPCRRDKWLALRSNILGSVFLPYLVICAAAPEGRFISPDSHCRDSGLQFEHRTLAVRANFDGYYVLEGRISSVGSESQCSSFSPFFNALRFS